MFEKHKQKKLLNKEILRQYRKLEELKLTETKKEVMEYTQQLVNARDGANNKDKSAVKAAVITGVCGLVGTLGGIALIQHGEATGTPLIGKGSILLPKTKI